MILNYLRFTFRDGVTEADRDRALAAISRTAALSSVSFSVVGQDLGDPAQGFTHAYCVAIADLPALRRYFDDPVHRAGDFVFLPLLARLVRTAMSDDGDPALGPMIAAVHAEKMAGDPAWAALLAGIPDARLQA